MTQPPPDRSLRLPREPYPGLRPFLPHEAALLFGRDRQVREVIEHLRQTQFVAILGGSGSGKSSLIHAGVTPELRSFGIPGAGDFWLTMSCTPGTNVALQEGQTARYTPVTRLAWRFATLLKSRGSDAADAARLDEIAAVFRQEAGFARLLDRYADELAVPPAFRGDEARLMFVLDQFEEIFHPTNDGVEDARLLVERVIDHFFSPHPHVYLVLTMRSEHLNDCATFLELPDAINRASYMVRRLGPDELRDAITGPAQRFLRLKARAEPGTAWPQEVVFEETVLERLLADTHAITHDPDHLPLMQHLLARLWAQARRREGDAAVPAAITPDDLRRAVHAGQDKPLDAATNVLRASLEAWADAAYRRRDPAQQRQLDALLRRMAYKDPNTGMFTQQRVNVDDAPLILGEGATRQTLHALIARDFLGEVDYFFWDDDDASRVTLKVSHESMIRGWAHFRTLIDAEGDRFQDYLEALLKCREWVDGGRTEALLLERNDLRRLDEAGLDATLARPDERRAWLRLLRLDRLGQRLLGVEGEFAGFLARSRAAQKAQRGQRTLMIGGLVALLVGLLLFLPFVGFSTLVQTPVAKRALLYYDAGVLAYGTQGLTGLEPADAARAYGRLVRAAQLVEAGRLGVGVPNSRQADWLLQNLGALTSVQRQGELLRSVAALVEPQVNGRLRDAIDGYLWNTPLDPRAAIFTPLAPIPNVTCDLGAGPVPGVVLRGNLGPGSAARYVFVPDVAAKGSTALTLVPLAVTNLADLRCDKARPVVSIPLALNPKVVLDSTLRFVFFTQDTPGETGPVRSVTMYELDWDSSPVARAEQQYQSALYLGRRDRAVVLDAKLAQAVDASAGESSINTVESWRIGSRRVFRFGEEVWQVGAGSAQRQPRDAVARFTQEAAWAPAGSPCEELRKRAGLDLRYVFELGPHCILADLQDEGQAAGATLVRVAVYQRPTAALLKRLEKDPEPNVPAAIATLNRFARIPPSGAGSRAPEAWRVGVAEDYEGWLVFRVETSSGNDLVEIGAPWSTCALAREAALMAGMRGNPCDPSEIANVLSSRP